MEGVRFMSLRVRSETLACEIERSLVVSMGSDAGKLLLATPPSAGEACADSTAMAESGSTLSNSESSSELVSRDHLSGSGTGPIWAVMTSREDPKR